MNKFLNFQYHFAHPPTYIYKPTLSPLSLNEPFICTGDDDSIGEGPGTLIPYWLFESPTK